MGDLNESHVFTDRWVYDQQSKISSTDGTPPAVGTVIADGSSFGFKTGGSSRQGHNNPGFRSLIQMHESATTGFLGTRTRWHIDYETAELVYRASPVSSYSGHDIRVHMRGYVFGLGNEPPDPGLISLSAANVSAQEQIVRNLRATQRSFQGGVFLGELTEAIHMLRHPAMSLRKGIDTYIHNAKKRVKGLKSETRANKIIEDTWLQFQYGWKPLTSDIEDAAKTFASVSKFFYEQQRVTGKGTQASMSETAHSQVATTEGFTVFWRRRMKSEALVRYIAGIEGGPESPSPCTLKSWGLSTTEFLPTVWELIPYSFVVDYFTNIGTIIESFSACLAGIKWVCQVTRRVNSTIVVGADSNRKTNLTNYGSAWRSESCSPGQNSVERSVVTRNDMTVVDIIPPLRFKIPGSSTKFLNLGALVSAKVR